MTVKIPKHLDEVVRTRAKHHCEYCQAAEVLTGQRFHVDHIIPRVLGGETSVENLCVACPACNGSKQDRTHAVDPHSNDLVSLFHPRQDQWQHHFMWSHDVLRITGLTPVGRATVGILKTNRPLSISARAVWVSVNRHPPKE